MISRPENVLQTDERGGWDGESVDEATGYLNPNLESTMDWAEHQRIVYNARNLVAGDLAVAGPSDVRTAFKELKAAYEDPHTRSELFVSKGIHQPHDKPHLQLRLESTYYNKGDVSRVSKNTFHLHVSAVDTADKTDSFQWTPVQFSHDHRNTRYYWPALAEIKTKSRALVRRNSVSQVDLEAHQAMVAQALKEIEDEKRKVAAAAKAASFEVTWVEFLTVHRLHNDSKYQSPSARFKSGAATMPIRSNTERPPLFHVKYSSDKGVYKTTPQGDPI